MSTPTNSTWVELRVYVDEQERDRLLVAGVGPFLADAARQGLSRRAYFLFERHAQRSYLRVRLDAVPDSMVALQQLLCATLRQRGLDAFCAQVEPAPAAQFTGHEELFRGAAAQALVEDFFAETTTFVLELIAAVDDNRSARLLTAFDLMVAHVVTVNRHIFEGARTLPYPNSFLSYRSHADGFFIMSKNPQAARHEFDTRYAALAGSLQDRLRRLLQQFDQRDAIISVAAQRWADYIDIFMPRVLAELAAGTIGIKTGLDGYIGDHYDLSISAFHRGIQDASHYQEFMRTDVEFHALRAMISLLYWTLYRFGLRLIDRYYLCHAVSRSFETVFDVDPAEVLAAISRHVAAHGSHPPSTGQHVQPT